METKSFIRSEIKAKLSAISDKAKQAEAVNKKLIEVSSLLDYKNILVFMPLKDEIDIIDFIKHLLKEQKNVFIPVSYDDGIMRFYRLKDVHLLTAGKYGISEPERTDEYIYDSSDLIIVPGVAFDESFNRMGRGKAYYDNFLRDKALTKIAVCYNEQLLESIPVEKHDIKMDYVITEKSV